MIDFVAIASRLAHIYSGRGQNGCAARVTAVCAVVVAAAVLIGAIIGRSPAYADGGASARNQAAANTPGDSDAMIRGYALGILRALSDRDANNWVRYWQARYACDAAAAYAREGKGAAPLERVLLEATGALCAWLEARLDVNPDNYLPRGGEERTVGLVASEPGAAVGYTLLTSIYNGDIFLLDPLGRVVHIWRDKPSSHIKLLSNGNLLAPSRRTISEFDPRGNLVWQYEIDFHHDFLKMPSGNVMLLVNRRKSREDVIAAGGNPEFVHEKGLIYDYLMEVRPKGASGGEVVWEWSVWDHLVQDFDPSKENYGAIAEHPELIDINFLLETISKHRQHEPDDWLHTNAIDYNPELDQIMLSPRHFSELWIIDHSPTTEEARGHSGGNSGMGGDLLYRWGNPRAYGHGDDADQRLFWQHQPQWIAPGLPGEGNILLFNNGLEFSGDERFYSSVDEIVPPNDGYRYRRNDGAAYPPDGFAWTYAAETLSDFYAPIRSGTQRLPNGNTLIVDGTAGTIFQATHEGRIVWKYVVPLNRRIHLRQGERASREHGFQTPYGERVHLLTNAVHRAYWYPPDHPGLQTLDLTPGAYIEDLPDIYDIAHAAIIAGDFGERLADSDFDIYIDENEDGDRRRLIYFKQPCAAEEARRRFFLHIIPADARDLRADRQEYGFNTRDFEFRRFGKISDGWCVAIRNLPDYAIERIRTGQHSGGSEVWRVDIELGE